MVYFVLTLIGALAMALLMCVLLSVFFTPQELYPSLESVPLLSSETSAELTPVTDIDDNTEHPQLH